MTKTKLSQATIIEATPTKVWNVLTNPDYIDQFLADGPLFSAWTDQSPVFSNGHEHIKRKVGEVLRVVPGLYLKYVAQTNGSLYPIETSYEIIPVTEGVEFHMEWNEIDYDEDYPKWLHEAKLVLQKIKWLAEFG